MNHRTVVLISISAQGFYRLEYSETPGMKQISTAPLDNERAPAFDRVFNDGMDEAPAQRAPSSWLYLLILIPILFGIFSLGYWSSNHAPLPPPTGPYDSSDKAPLASQSKIIVHVAGAVRKPGVYTLPMDARIYEAVQKAGGTLPNGDANALNLAAWAEDGSRIEVPFKAKHAAPRETTEAPLITTAQPPQESSSETPSPTPAKAKPASKTTDARDTKPPPARKINLNKATLEELGQLPGVGPATAEKIIEYRKTNGAFSSVDDLDDVNGIGEKKLEKIRPYATVR